MDFALLLVRVLLAIVFSLAGIAKLLNLKASRKAVSDFGLPTWLANPLGLALPLTELAVAVLLLPLASVWWGALGALVLLFAFVLAISVNMAMGRKPDCHCFGQLHSKPIGWPTLARNVVLAFPAIVLLWQAPTNPGLSIASVGDFSRAQLFAGAVGTVTLIVLATLSWLILHLFRQNGRLLLRIEALEANRAFAQHQMPTLPVPQGLPIGTKAVPFDLLKVEGGRATLEGFLTQGKSLLLISTDPNCSPCNALMPDVAGWQKSLAAELRIVLLSHGSHADNRAKAAKHGLENMLVEKNHEIAEKYHVVGTPSAVLIRSDGTIGSPAVGGAEAIRQLVASRVWTEAGFAAFMKALAQPPQLAGPKPALPVGSPAPAFSLLDLDANAVHSTSFNGNGTVLLFWNPGCGFCQRMLAQLKDWEKVQQASAPRLVLISSGSRETNREMGLESTVLIDDKFGVGQSYGVNGTPSGLLIDAHGKSFTRRTTCTSHLIVQQRPAHHDRS